MHLRVGDRLTVTLGSSYRRPVSSNRFVIIRRRAAGGYPTGQEMTATFKAVTAGRASVSSETDAACLHVTPRCEIAQQIWVVHIVVR